VEVLRLKIVHGLTIERAFRHGGDAGQPLLVPNAGRK
jgi:hypothetical protein